MKGQFPRKRGYQRQKRSKKLLIEVVNSSINHIDLSNVSTENVNIIQKYVRRIAASQLKVRARSKHPVSTGLIIGRTIKRIIPIAVQYGAVISSYFPKPPVPDETTTANPEKPKATVSWKGHIEK